MTVTVTDVAQWVNASPTEPTLPALLLDAVELVNGHLGITGIINCPERTRDLAVKTLVSELWARRNSPGGGAQWGPDGQVIRLSRDPLVSVRSMLRPYRSLGTVG